ncbi:MAG: zinc ribbon domain-containing protein, partial [Planctomycetes bacterium]|nr:zinc ribbon domain-containing protein [Planctomycetota bacterium]
MTVTVNASTEKTLEIHAFQIAGDDLGPLFTDAFGLRCNALSPLRETLFAYVPGSRAPSAELRTTASDPLVRRACYTIAQPTLCLRQRTGGGQVPASDLSACHVHGQGGAFVVIVPSFEGSYLVQTFASAADYLAWWLDTVATRVDEAGPNFLPPPLSLEGFVYALHSIDAFRRSAYASQLAYQPKREPTIGTDEFGTSIGQSLKSGDLRWLLPSFVVLTPGLDLRGFDAGGEHVDLLERLGFFTSGREEGGRSVLVFGEAGRTMGVEFFRTWGMAVGFEHAALTCTGERVLHRGFLAPTAFGNHLAMIDRGADGRVAVNHQNLSLTELSDRMAILLGEAISIPDADPTGGVAPAAAPAAPAPTRVASTVPAAAAVPTSSPAGAAPGSPGRFCVGCGAALTPTARFCAECG